MVEVLVVRVPVLDMFPAKVILYVLVFRVEVAFMVRLPLISVLSVNM